MPTTAGGVAFWLAMAWVSGTIPVDGGGLFSSGLFSSGLAPGMKVFPVDGVGEGSVISDAPLLVDHRISLARLVGRPEGRPGAPLSEQLAHRHGRVGHAVREAPLVVVPGQDTHERAVHHLGLVEVERGRVRIVVEVDGDVGLVGIGQHALQRTIGCGADRVVDLLDGGLALGGEHEVDRRNVGGRHADRGSVELALQLRQDEADGLGGPRGSRDHRQRGGTGPVQVLVHLVEGGLIVGVGMDRRHEAALDPDEIVEHHRSESSRLMTFLI